MTDQKASTKKDTIMFLNQKLIAIILADIHKATKKNMVFSVFMISKIKN